MLARFDLLGLVSLRSKGRDGNLIKFSVVSQRQDCMIGGRRQVPITTLLERESMLRITYLALLLYIGTLWDPSSSFATPTCDYLRREPCEGEACLAKYKAIQDCELAVIAEDQARSRRRQLQRQRDLDNKRKKELEAKKNESL
jgi:hypothetical protein